MSPEMNRAFHSGVCKVVVATTLGRLFMRSPNSPVSCILGHASANP